MDINTLYRDMMRAFSAGDMVAYRSFAHSLEKKFDDLDKKRPVEPRKGRPVHESEHEDRFYVPFYESFSLETN
jgi:hypothetical protein